MLLYWLQILVTDKYRCGANSSVSRPVSSVQQGEDISNNSHHLVNPKPATTSSPLTWAVLARYERPLPNHIPVCFGFTYRWKEARAYAEEILAARHNSGWQPQSELHATICNIAVTECGWVHGCFELRDDLQVVFWAYEDGLDTDAAFLELEILLGVSFTPAQIEVAMQGTIESFLDQLSEFH